MTIKYSLQNMSIVRSPLPVFTHTGETARRRSEDVKTSYQVASQTNATRMQHHVILAKTTTTSSTTTKEEEVVKEREDVAGVVKRTSLEKVVKDAQPKQAAPSAPVVISNLATSAGSLYGE